MKKSNTPFGTWPYSTGKILKNNFSTVNRCLVLAPVALVLIAAHRYGLGGTSMAMLFNGSAPGKFVVAVCVCFAGITAAELIWRIILVLRYRPAAGCPDKALPLCTVVVPAFNEGRQVFDTLKSLAASNYPEDRLQLIAVDDGSEDDTWIWIQRAGHYLGQRLMTIRQPVNLGKRHALHAGFERSTGEILITVDSDSMVEADTLRNLVAPFVTDRDVGGVAGNVRVLNRDQGLIPRMIDVIFVYSFDFMRASQSMVRTVMCTPGALAAYRKSVVMGVLNEWMDQTFCGRPANIGEDRAMTNLILREGYDVVFQQNAMVYTQVPVKYLPLCKMYLRWARSNVRETISMTRFIFKPFRRGAKLGARLNLILSWTVLTKFQVLLVLTWALMICHPLVFGPHVVCGIIASSSLSAALYAWKFGRLSSLLAYAYGFFFFAGLFWITPYALMTPHKSGWLTRQLSPAGKSAIRCLP